jgi:putative transposase
MVTTKQRRQVVTHLLAAFAAHDPSARRVCRLVGLSRSRWHYRSRRSDDAEWRERLKTVAAEKPQWGYELLYDRMRRRGWIINHKKVLRLYREEGLALVRHRRRKRVAAARVPLPTPRGRTERWSMDFVSDRFADGRAFRCFTLVDDFTREAIAIEVSPSLPAWRITAVLDRVMGDRGRPRSIVCDNGPEFSGRVFDSWAHANGIALQFIRPGKPVENAFVESFNGRFRAECLNAHWFLNTDHARVVIETWRLEYNSERPHSSLGRRTPAEFTASLETDPDPSPQPQRLTA